MKSQPTFSIKGVSQLFSTIFLLFLLSLFVAGNAQAKRPQPDPGPSAADNEVSWGGDIEETSTRVCSLSQMAPDGTSGKFICQLNSDHIIYDLSWMDSEPIHNRGDDWRCNPGTLWAYIDPDMEYTFSWNGDCATGCGVSVVNVFSNYGAIGGSVGRMTIEGFATATTLAGGNPFAEPQSLTIDYLHVTFFGVKGRDKVLAVCKLTPTEDDQVTFFTSPVPIFE
jgi:hypothetical protein